MFSYIVDSGNHISRYFEQYIYFYDSYLYYDSLAIQKYIYLARTNFVMTVIKIKNPLVEKSNLFRKIPEFCSESSFILSEILIFVFFFC